MTNWQIGLICLVFALVLMALTQMVSLGSCAAAVLFPVLTLFIKRPLHSSRRRKLFYI